MGNASAILAARRTAKRELTDAFSDTGRLRIVHYSCEDFNTYEDGRSTRVTALAIMDVGANQTRLFALAKEAELSNRTLPVTELDLNGLERSMLSRFYQYVANNRNAQWLHWNMRDDNYGFTALEHRARVLGIEPVEISDRLKSDLSLILKATYCGHYVDGHPRMYAIAKLNDIELADFLKGPEEAAAFRQGNYVALYRSTLRKVRVIHQLARLEYEGRLMTNTNAWDVRRITAKGMIDNLLDSTSARIAGALITIFGFVIAIWTLF